MEEEKPTGKRTTRLAFAGGHEDWGERFAVGLRGGICSLSPGNHTQVDFCTSLSWVQAGHRHMQWLLSSWLPFPETLTRTLWHSHTQKSNLIIDTVIPWIPSLATANGWCTNDSIRTLIGPL